MTETTVADVREQINKIPIREDMEQEMVTMDAQSLCEVLMFLDSDPALDSARPDHPVLLAMDSIATELEEQL